MSVQAIRDLNDAEIDEVSGAGGWRDGAIGGIWGGATAQAAGGDMRTVGIAAAGGFAAGYFSGGLSSGGGGRGGRS